MKMKNKWSILVMIIAISGILFTSCNEDDPTYTEGQVVIKLTDAPFPINLLAEANVNITKIEMRNTADTTGNPYVTLFEGDTAFNLLDLTGGITATLADLTVPVGNYDLIRLYVDSASVVLLDSTEYELNVPSGSQSGIKAFIDPSVNVVGELTTELVLDFDVAQSFVVLGNPNTPAGINGFNFKPVIHVSNQSETGSLAGEAVDSTSAVIQGVQVDVYTPDSLFTSTFTNTNGQYMVFGLPAGVYSASYYYMNDSIVIDSIDVVAGNVVTRDVQF